MEMEYKATDYSGWNDEDIICCCPYCDKDITLGQAKTSIHCCPHCGEWLDLFIKPVVA